MEASRIAKRLAIPPMAAKQAADLFKEFSNKHGSSNIKDWRMSEAEFRRALVRLQGKRKDEELDEQWAMEAFLYADLHRSGVIDFAQFAFWFSVNSFSEDLNLDDTQKEMRALARKHGLLYSKIDRYKRVFDEFDEDKSGAIDPEEFENLISKCGKVPTHVGLPAARVQQWWRDADSDGNGLVDFEEFLIFQRKYFDSDGGAGGQASNPDGSKRSGFENYYRGIRKTCWT